MTTIQDAITQYVACRQAAGADFRATARLLDTFGRAVGPAVLVADIPPAAVRAFVDGHGPVTRYWIGCLSYSRNLARTYIATS